MFAASLTEPAQVLVLQAPVEMLPLAASSLARHLEITEGEAMAQLQSGCLHLANGGGTAQLISLLKAFGVVLRGTSDNRVSVSLQATDVAQVAPRLAAVLQQDLALICHKLRCPGGLVLTGLGVTDAEQIRADARKIKALTVLVSPEATATYDVFASAAIDARRRRGLSAHLAMTGLAACRFSGALAGQLTKSQADQLVSRFEDCGLLMLDRAFQRFDLFLTGIGELDARDVAEFLSTRTDLSGAMLECVTPLSPLRIETGLPRSAAVAFSADYAAIGLQTLVRLTARNS